MKEAVKPNRKSARDHRYAVIMAGGNGTRLWPVSRTEKPKQFHSILGERTLLQTMHNLVQKSLEPDQIFVQVPVQYVPYIQQQLPKISSRQILVEPEARDTGPAFAFALSTLVIRDPEAIVAFYYADHFVQSERAFHSALQSGFQTVAEEPEHLVLIGVRPLYPNTGLGYIEFGEKISIPRSKAHAFRVSSFVEKPALQRARRFVSAQSHLWNTGYKVGHAQHILNLLARSSDPYRLGIPRILEAIAAKRERVLRKEFRKLPRMSFEYLITEKADQLLVIASDMMWSDVGDWGAIDDLMRKGRDKGVHTIGRVAEHGSKNALLVSNHRPIVGVGLENIIVVETKEGVLVMSKDGRGDVKQALQKLRAQHPKSL